MNLRQWWRDSGGRRLGWNLRRWRDQQLIKLKLERSNKPAILVERQSLLVSNLSSFVAAQVILERPDFVFMQIGGFEGDSTDDLRELISLRNLRGVIVEPQPEAYEILKKNYCDQTNLTLLNAVITENDEPQTFYRQASCHSGLASLDRSHLQRHGVPEEDILAISVKSYTVESAMREAGLDHLDFLQIDAEGYDFKILMSIDFLRVQPKAICFESKHMSMRESNQLIQHLSEFGYRFLAEKKDIIAFKPTQAAS